MFFKRLTTCRKISKGNFSDDSELEQGTQFIGLLKNYNYTVTRSHNDFDYKNTERKETKAASFFHESAITT